MDCIAHGVPKSWTRLSDFHFYFQALYHYTQSLVPTLFTFTFNFMLLNLNINQYLDFSHPPNTYIQIIAKTLI